MGGKAITHEKDIEYFKEYPAPIMEHIHKLHHTNVNSTITFFGPMLYFMLRGLCSEKVLEIGHAEGYTAHYLAHAVKDTGIRFGVLESCMYYGVDIVQTEKVREALTAQELPNTIINLDSALLTPDTFKGVTFDVIFQDGAHDTEHVLYEFDTMWPQLRADGKGYWIMHDIQGPAEEGYKIIRDKIMNRKIDAEFVALDCIYGLAIIRKIDNFDYAKRNWTDV